MPPTDRQASDATDTAAQAAGSTGATAVGSAPISRVTPAEAKADETSVLPGDPANPLHPAGHVCVVGALRDIAEKYFGTEFVDALNARIKAHRDAVNADN